MYYIFNNTLQLTNVSFIFEFFLKQNYKRTTQTHTHLNSQSTIWPISKCSDCESETCVPLPRSTDHVRSSLFTGCVISSAF